MSLASTAPGDPQSSINDPKTKYDNFYTPGNRDWYANFRYANLRPTNRRIRLLRIHPMEANRDDNSTLRCDLLDDVSLAKMTCKFTTISYCAGDPKQTETVLVNSLHFNAFANLGHALRQARHFWHKHHSGRELLLWADQICIDQSNPYERSHQVGFMGDIYAAAEQVLVCLSTEGNPDGGIEWLTKLSYKTSTFPGWKDAGYLRRCWVDERLHHSWDVFVKTILNSAWLSRAWVRQEFIRSRDAYFIASHESIHWSLLNSDLKTYRWAVQQPNPSSSHRAMNHADPCTVCQLGETHTGLFENTSTIWELLKLKERSSYGFQDLLHNLEQVTRCKSSDPRDLIYAFFGISNHAYGIQPDYSSSLSVNDVCINLVRNVITHSGHLGILQRAYATRNSQSPSWVPDWRNTIAGIPPFEGDIYRNVSHSTFSFRPNAQGYVDRALQAQGLCNTTLQSRIGSTPTKGPSSLDACDFQTDIEDVRVWGNAKEGDAIWILHGANRAYVFRRQYCQQYELIGEARYLAQGSLRLNIGNSHHMVETLTRYEYHVTRLRSLIKDLTNLVENSDPSVQNISIC